MANNCSIPNTIAEFANITGATSILHSAKPFLLCFLISNLANFVGTPAAAQSNFCGIELVLDTVDFTGSGGQDSSVNAAEAHTRLKAEGGSFGSQNSSNSEIGFRFIAINSGPARVRFGGIVANGRLIGFGNINEASISVAAKLVDLTIDDEIATANVVNESENGAFSTETTKLVNAIPFAITEFEANLLEGHEYAAFVRTIVKANGLAATSDFKNDGRRVSIGSVTVSAELTDSDGDGLYDIWETNGFDADCDPETGIDVDLVAMGANPNHKDLFLEMDWMPGAEPRRATISTLKNVFALAPADAGGVVNPDNTNGITVHVDAGSLVDPTAREGTGLINSCGDGMDNDSNGLTDAGDPACLVGDVEFSNLGSGGGTLGRGTQVPIANISDLETDQDGDGTVEFYETRNPNFQEARRQLFRYVLSAPRNGSLLGQSELGGNDLVIFPVYASEVTGCVEPDSQQFPSGTSALTLIHELGHALGLRHNGASGPNMKPNLVSVMNYANALGIPRNDPATSDDLDGDGVVDCRIADYSPPRVPGGRLSAPIPQPDGTLDESSLDENKRVDPTDTANRMVYYDQTADQFVNVPLNSRPNWDGDDTTGEPDVPSDITNDGMLTELVGFNEWDALLLSQLEFEDSDTRPKSNAAVTIEIDDVDEILEIYRQVNSTDIRLEKEQTTKFVVAGQALTYSIKVINQGPNRGEFLLTDTLPASAQILSLPPTCNLVGAQAIECKPQLIEPNDSVDYDFVIRIPVDIDCDGQQTLEIANTAEVDLITGEDTNPNNNRATDRAQLLCVRYEYAAKFTCGEQNQLHPSPLTRGIYASTINIHNPNDERVNLFKKIAMTTPPEVQKQGAIISLAVDQLDYDGALKTSCSEILHAAGTNGNSAQFAEGFLVVQSPRSLDVTAQYSVTTAQTSIHVEQVRERKREPMKKPPKSRSRADLMPVEFSCIPPPAGQGNLSKEIEVSIRNIGSDNSPASMSNTTFATVGATVVSTLTPAVSSGGTVSIKVAIPSQCTGECNFEIMADGSKSIEELDETNNTLAGWCLPFPG